MNRSKALLYVSAIIVLGALAMILYPMISMSNGETDCSKKTSLAVHYSKEV